MLFHIFSLLAHAIAGLVAGTCLLRLYMQFQRINLSLRTGNPLAPFIFALTNWLVMPLRRVVPAVGRLDTASLLAALLVAAAKLVLLSLAAGVVPDGVALVLGCVFELLNVSISSLVWLVMAYALLSWVRSGTDVTYFLAQLIDPLLRPIRRVLPLIGGVDLSPLALLLGLQVLEIVLHSLQIQLV
jgi:YggT family protein